MTSSNNDRYYGDPKYDKAYDDVKGGDGPELRTSFVDKSNGKELEALQDDSPQEGGHRTDKRLTN
jgi:hypothetical protein